MDQILYILFFDVLGKVVPIGVTMFCYCKVYSSLKLIYGGFSGSQYSKPGRVFLYPLIQIFCFFPEIIMDTIFMSMGIYYPLWASIIKSITHRSWALLNLCIYWFMRPESQDDEQENENYNKLAEYEDGNENL